MNIRRTLLLLLSLGIAGGVFVFDRLTKIYFFLHPSSSSWHGLIGFTQHPNFGLLADIRAPQWLIISFTILVLLGVGALIFKTITQHSILPTVALALIFGGAVGNLLDRITFGYVFDWLLLFGRSVINIADIAIAGGMVLLIVRWPHQKLAPIDKSSKID